MHTLSSLTLSTHSLHSFSSLILFAHYLHSLSSLTIFTYSLHLLSSLTLFTHSLHVLFSRTLFTYSPRTLSTQTAFRWTSWKISRFVHPDRFFGGQTQYRLNHPINEYAELLSFFHSTFSTYSCFLCLWVSFMLNVFR